MPVERLLYIPVTVPTFRVRPTCEETVARMGRRAVFHVNFMEFARSGKAHLLSERQAGCLDGSASLRFGNLLSRSRRLAAEADDFQPAHDESESANQAEPFKRAVAISKSECR